MTDFIRLRQVCLAVEHLAEAERQLCALLDVEACHRDERVARYGLENVLLCVGPTFLELVAPSRPDTAAGRFLARNPPPLSGAYMAIFDCSDLDAWRQRAVDLELRIINERRYERYRNVQLHPRDTGATMVEIHQNVGGEDLLGHYDPAGMAWSRHIRTRTTQAIGGLEITSPEPARMADTWSRLLGRSAVVRDGGLRIALDLGHLDFLPDAAERVTTVTITVSDPYTWLSRARSLGHEAADDCVTVAGVRWRPVGSADPARQ